MVRFLADISPKAAAPVIRQILAEPHDEHLISVCLQVISDPQDLDKVRLLLKHPRWHVRMHAASAIGRLGGCDDDVESLLPLLSDAQWWVRYRTAQTIAHLLQDPDALVCLRDRQQDRFARDILTQVLAEQTLAVGTV
jgi:HEAT repeat protein